MMKGYQKEKIRFIFGIFILLLLFGYVIVTLWQVKNKQPYINLTESGNFIMYPSDPLYYSGGYMVVITYLAIALMFLLFFVVAQYVWKKLEKTEAEIKEIRLRRDKRYKERSGVSDN